MDLQEVLRQLAFLDWEVLGKVEAVFDRELLELACILDITHVLGLAFKLVLGS